MHDLATFHCFVRVRPKNTLVFVCAIRASYEEDLGGYELEILEGSKITLPLLFIELKGVRYTVPSEARIKSIEEAKLMAAAWSAGIGYYREHSGDYRSMLKLLGPDLLVKLMDQTFDLVVEVREQ